MKRKRKPLAFELDSVPVPATDEKVEVQTDAFVPREVAETGPKVERLSIALADGKVNWASMRGETRDRLHAAFKDDPEALAMLGISVPGAQGITDENARAALKALAKADGIIVSFFAGLFFKLPLDRDIANDAFEFTKEQLDEMSPRAARLANKYSTAAMLKYQDEIALLGMFGLYLSQQTQTALMTQAMRNLQKKRQPPHVQDTPEGMKVPVNGGAVANETQ